MSTTDKKLRREIKGANLDYLTLERYQKDNIEGTLHFIIVEDKIVGCYSLIENSIFQMTYLKRLYVMKKYRGLGLAEMTIDHASSTISNYPTLAITPWSDNITMKYLLSKLSFKYQYTFLNNYELWVK